MRSTNYNKTLVFIGACAAIFIFGISIITLGSTLPQLTKEFGLHEIDKGTLASILPLGILAGSLVFGPIADRYSYKYLLAVSIFFVITGFQLIAFAGKFHHLGFAFFFIGMGGGAINGATSALVSDFSEDLGENKGANLSILGVFFGLGSLGMPILLNLLVKWFEYKQILFGIGFLMLVPFIFTLMISYPAPKQVQSMTLKNVGKLLKNTILLMFGLALFFQSGWESLVNNWSTTYLIDAIGFPEKLALSMLTLYVLVFTIGRISLGYLLKKISGKWAMYFSTTTATIGAFLLVFAASETLIIVSIILLGIGLAAAFPVMLGYVGDKFAAWSGTAFSIIFSIALIGNIIINYLTGLITNSQGISFYPYILVTAGVCTTLFVFITLKNEK
ncbi:sugar MFS transporter [Bacteroidota bacterium]